LLFYNIILFIVKDYLNSHYLILLHKTYGVLSIQLDFT